MQTSTPFTELDLHPGILRALDEAGYSEPTPIQRQAIPILLDGRDLMATAQTGTGKTAAFALPILQFLYEEYLYEEPVLNAARLRALILTPTRELALQIEENLQAYGRHLPLKTLSVLGGVPIRPQIDALRKAADILVATPGRLLDLIRQKVVGLDNVQVLVLDEADRMLDMGFIDEVLRIVECVPRNRQTMLFSATLSPEVKSLAANLLRDPATVAVSPPTSVVGAIDQRVMFVAQADKRDLLTWTLKAEGVERALVFTRTKYGADRIVSHIVGSGIRAESIHSNKAQTARQKALSAFDEGKVPVLVATDIVSRGIDVEGISHVINYELPSTPEGYVHRVGRTARAGAEGIALSLCDASEVSLLREIERSTGSPLTTIEDQPYHSSAIASLFNGKEKKNGAPFRQRRGWRSFSPRRGSRQGR
jgi:ATP-dependent RNA helicase RhlE